MPDETLDGYALHGCLDHDLADGLYLDDDNPIYDISASANVALPIITVPMTTSGPKWMSV